MLCVLSILILMQVKAQDKFNAVQLSIEGKEYQQMNMVIFPIREKRVEIKGETENGKDWLFFCPDSLSKNVGWIRFEIPTGVDTLTHTISFSILTDMDTIKVGQIVIKDSAKLKIRYATTYSKFSNRVLDDRFFLSDKDDSELSIYASYFLKFVEGLGKDEFVDAVKKHPDSYYLMTELVDKVNRAAPKDEVEYIYNNFSEEMKDSFLGKKVYEYLYLVDHNHFENFRLQVWNSDQIEPIAMDRTKYNLIVFSASWCAPCHEQIPVLKEIFNDLNGKLDMVYISIDEKQSVESWRQLMIKEQIPWRSLLALTDFNKIGEKYKIVAIPHTLLLHPDGTMENIDVRKTEEKDRLYSLVNALN